MDTIGQVSAVDADQDGNARVRYELSEGYDMFIIDGSTGVIYPTQPVDRESQSEYQVSTMVQNCFASVQMKDLCL